MQTAGILVGRTVGSGGSNLANTNITMTVRPALVPKSGNNSAAAGSDDSITADKVQKPVKGKLSVYYLNVGQGDLHKDTCRR
jgi:hypothetical protein